MGGKEKEKKQMEQDKKIDTSESLDDIEMHKKIIDGMTQTEMARLVGVLLRRDIFISNQEHLFGNIFKRDIKNSVG